ncbi:MAG: hypothetical protein CVT60_02550 [Actinobacteria bacterium HGW-Actinobacteria-10]|nr:MAG: hypothetical protein CVT60_02550 [Actinobacteria bacterium HGW-Actinobacteria-10]
MSQREIKNIPASVRARLLNEAKASRDSYDQVLQYFAIERFLYRLAQTEWADRLIVKGAIMLRAWGTPLGRPTRDIDFLGNIDNSPEAVERAVRECLAVEYPDDGLVFDQNVETGEINVMDRYPGVRVVVRGNLDGGTFKLQLDIGIGDAVVPDPEWVEYPTLLDLEAPRVFAYQPVTALAEKFETVVSRGWLTAGCATTTTCGCCPHYGRTKEPKSPRPSGRPSAIAAPMCRSMCRWDFRVPSSETSPTRWRGGRSCRTDASRRRRISGTCARQSSPSSCRPLPPPQPGRPTLRRGIRHRAGRDDDEQEEERRRGRRRLPHQRSARGHERSLPLRSRRHARVEKCDDRGRDPHHAIRVVGHDACRRARFGGHALRVPSTAPACRSSSS